MDKILKSALAVIFFTSVLIGCGKENKKQKEQNAELSEQVKVEILQKTEIAREIELSTVLQGYENMNIAPSVTGKIERIFVEIGSRVSKGDLLVRMDQNQYNTTKLTSSNLAVEMNRMEVLKETGSISQQKYDQVKLSYDQTKEALEFLQSNTFVKAQFNGIISAKNYEEGELYSGKPILVLTQINTLKALINVPERYYPFIKVGMEVSLSSEIYKEKSFTAVVEMVYPTIDASTHSFQVKLKVPNAKELLRPGMYAKTSLFLGKEETIVVPYQSVLKLVGSNDRYLFLNENGYAKRISVRLGQRFDEKIEVFAPEIVEGAKLVTVGQSKLVDGVKLNVLE